MKMFCNMLRISVLFFFVFSIFTIVSCQRGQNTATPPATEETTQQSEEPKESRAMPQAQAPEAVEVIEGTEWFDEIPSSVPEFKYAILLNSTKSEANGVKDYNIYYEGGDIASINKYESELVAKGFRTKKNAGATRGVLAAEKGNVIVNLTVDEKTSKVQVIVRN